MKYSGELSKPLPSQKGRWLSADQLAGTAFERDDPELLRRMDLLFDAHNIKRGDFEALCYSLAHEHVQGFKERRVGRPRKWTEYDRARLYLAVEATNRPVMEAVEILAEQSEWTEKVKATSGAGRLYNELYKADPGIVETLREASPSELDTHTNSPVIDVREPEQRPSDT